MSIHTICARGYRRIVVRPSKVSVGAVQIEILGADRQVLALVNLGAEDVGVLASALDMAAAEAESNAALLGARAESVGAQLFAAMRAA